MNNYPEFNEDINKKKIFIVGKRCTGKTTMIEHLTKNKDFDVFDICYSESYPHYQTVY